MVNGQILHTMYWWREYQIQYDDHEIITSMVHLSVGQSLHIDGILDPKHMKIYGDEVVQRMQIVPIIQI